MIRTMKLKYPPFKQTQILWIQIIYQKKKKNKRNKNFFRNKRNNNKNFTNCSQIRLKLIKSI